jgi:hypothetical protein
MTKFLLPVMFFVLTTTTTPQKCSNDDFGSMCEVKAAVIRLLSYPAYTSWDEKILNRAGDAAALALVRSLSMEDLNSSEKERQTLLILKLAFEAPQLIAVNTDRRPTAAMLLLGYISNTNYGKGYSTEIENTRISSTTRVQESLLNLPPSRATLLLISLTLSGWPVCFAGRMTLSRE